MSKESIIWCKVVEHSGWRYEYTYLNEKEHLKFKPDEIQIDYPFLKDLLF
jgi:hypothetical protein